MQNLLFSMIFIFLLTIIPTKILLFIFAGLGYLLFNQ